MNKLALIFYLPFTDFAIARLKTTFILKVVNSGQYVITYLRSIFSNHIFNPFFVRKPNNLLKGLGLSLSLHNVKTFGDGFNEETFNGEGLTFKHTASDSNII